MSRGTGTQDLLRVRNLRTAVRAGNRYLPVLAGVDLDVKSGEIVGLVGESGSGKSMTALAIMGLLMQPQIRIDDGEMWFRDVDLLKMDERERRRLRGSGMSMIFQEPMTSLDPCFTIGSHLVETIQAHRKVSKAAARRDAIAALKEVRLPDADRIMDRYSFELSGGMQQRVLIAMAIACSPSIVIADEPTTALDVTVEAQILDLLSALRDSTGAAMLFISHDLVLVSEICDRVYVMYAGRIVETGTAKQVLTDPQHPYTKALLGAIPRSGSERLAAIPGDVPEVGRALPACPFAPRCEMAWHQCVEDVPAFSWTRPQVSGAACHLLDQDGPTGMSEVVTSGH